MPNVDQLWGEASALPVRILLYGDGLEVQDDDGRWSTIVLPLSQNDSLQQIIPSPTFAGDQILYLLGRFSLWRSLDGGATWQRWSDERLEGRTYNNELKTVAAAPLGGGNHELWIGTGAGELWALQPGEMAFAPVVASTPTPYPTSALPTPTPTPSLSAVPSATSTALATASNTPPAPASEPSTGEPPPGLYRPTGPVASLWEASPALQQALGWAKTQEAAPLAAARQEFVRGTMIWRGDIGTIYVIGRDGRWEAYADTFAEGEPELDPSLVPPTGLYQPIRGFGKLWRSNQEVRERMGWALSKEQGYNGFVQEFERGLLLSGGDRTFALIGQASGEVAN
jgi:hypothetical protein